MEKFRIEGGRRLEGMVRVSGAKNAALPAMAAALLTPEPVRLRNVPRVRDIVTMGRLLAHMEAHVETSPAEPEYVTIRAEKISNAEAPYELVKTMRASVLTLGPLVARTGYARVSLPGGCAIGARPIDLHLKALEKMGAAISTEHGYVEARAPEGGLRGAELRFEKITVTGTENAMMAAALASGETVIENAAREPEIADLARLLITMGAKVEGAGTATLRICGAAELHGATHTVIPDRIEAGTLLVAGAITGGELLLTQCEPAHLTAVTEKLAQAGVVIRAEGGNALRVHNGGPLTAVDVTTEEYPGFATDMQAQYMALMTQAEGASVITETIFENRFLHAQEMVRMGAHISIEGRRAVVRGPVRLTGASVQASDLRASASLVLAALVAEGETVIDRVYHLDRGYERLEEKLGAVGAKIERIK
ncbi:MAG: UDP-N-acetylglucosamine 1-carboxyvinyltransferase [Acidobacteria bacterium]|nr:UDP-N-acetylglucosamine 1-carboxyvinyltransferase [Acidobacteriota bacterium]MBI3664563.1 UDP-N-acetylglucosamine 1-carboxyvinyltransferase [Acidobacteriota bacterium]